MLGLVVSQNSFSQISVNQNKENLLKNFSLTLFWHLNKFLVKLFG